MRTLTLTVLILAGVGVAAASPCTLGPGVWNEKGSGDSGKFPSNADITAGSGALTTICGNLSDATGGGDMYEIYISGSSFSAITSDRDGSTLNPALYLFNLSGVALFGENDISGTDDQAELTGLDLTPGWYYLLIVPDGQDPMHGSTSLFTDFDGSTGLQTPSSNEDLTSYSNTGDSSGEYLISLTGADFAVPEPATFGLMGAALLGLALKRRRQAHCKSRTSTISSVFGS